MTTIATPTTATRSDTLWRPAAAAAVVAATATAAVAAVTHRAGASLEIDGEAIPPMGFFQLTLICTVLGFGLAVAARRWATNPRQAFVRATVALTAVSFVPDLLVLAETSTRLSLMTAHVVAAAIFIPIVAKRLATKRA